MLKREVNIRITGVGLNSKSDACRGLDVYVDDDLDKLEYLVGIVDHRFLFSWEYNKHLTTKDIASRVTSWRELYSRISDLSK